MDGLHGAPEPLGAVADRLGDGLVVRLGPVGRGGDERVEEAARGGPVLGPVLRRDVPIADPRDHQVVEEDLQP